MASPSVTAVDFLLVTFGVAPLKVLIAYWFYHRKKKRDLAIKQAYTQHLKETKKE